MQALSEHFIDQVKQSVLKSQTDPSEIQKLWELGQISEGQHQFLASAFVYQQLLQIEAVKADDPLNVDIWTRLGLILMRTGGSMQVAAELFKKVLAKRDDSLVQVYYLRALYESGDYEHFDKIVCQLKQQGSPAVLWMVFAYHSMMKGQKQEAEAWAKKSIQSQQTDPFIILDQALFLYQTQNVGLAEGLFFKAWEQLLHPVALYNWLHCQYQLNKVARALNYVSAALSRFSHCQVGYLLTLVADLYYHQKQYDRALSVLEQLERVEGKVQGFLLMAQCYLKTYDYPKAVVYYKKAKEQLAIEKSKPIKEVDFFSPWLFLFDPDFQVEVLTEATQLMIKQLSTDLMNIKESAVENKQRTTEQLNVMFISSDAYEHATMILMKDFFKHTPKHIKVGFIHTGQKIDKYTEYLKQSVDYFEHQPQLGTGGLVKLIKDWQTDILIDLKGFTENHRLAVFNQRVAPLQVSFLGFPGSLHHEAITHMIVDPVVYNQKEISEAPIFVPCYQPPSELRAGADRLNNLYAKGLASLESVKQKQMVEYLKESGQIGDQIKFDQAYLNFCQTYNVLPTDRLIGYMNLHHKLNQRAWDYIKKIIRMSDQVKLFLLAPPTQLEQKALLAYLMQEGLLGAVRLMPLTEHSKHVQRLTMLDFFIDHLPCSAHTTAADVVSAGRLLVPLMGDHFAGRVSSSVMMHLGCEVAQTEEQGLGMIQRYIEQPFVLIDHTQRLGDQIKSEKNAMKTYVKEFYHGLIQAYEQKLKKKVDLNKQ